MNKQICFLFIIFLFVIIVGSLGMMVSREGLNNKCRSDEHWNNATDRECKPNNKP
jgi:hypothetical protein